MVDRAVDAFAPAGAAQAADQRPHGAAPLATSVPGGKPRPSLERRIRRRAAVWRQRLTRYRYRASRVTVRASAWNAVAVSTRRGLRRKRFGLDDPGSRFTCAAHTLDITLPDAAALVRLAASGVLAGRIWEVRLRLEVAPRWLLSGVRPFSMSSTAEHFSWRFRRDTLDIRLRWSSPRAIDKALHEAVTSVTRVHPWDQTSGAVYVLHRTAWLEGTSSWPQGQTAAQPPEAARDERGRPLGPYLAHEHRAAAGWPIITAVANPHGRRLIGAATPYRLVPASGELTLRDSSGRVALRLDPAVGPEAAVLSSRIQKYATVTVDFTAPDDPFAVHSLRTLAACGMVFAAREPAIREQLNDLGLVAVTDGAAVHDLRGYALSVEASRRMTITGDPALRRTTLGGQGALPLPTVSVVLSSMRADHVATCLGYLAAQTYPALEVVVGLHGYDVPEQTREQWQALLPFPLRVTSFDADLTLGMVLGQLSRMADGDLVTKVDDDDHYGPNHVTDLVLAWHTSGADLIAKGPRFVHFPDLGQTIDRTWAAPEVLEAHPAGGTLFLARSTLLRVGGWSHSSRHVDTDLMARVRDRGGLTYRTHALEYVYVRRTDGHTWAVENHRLIKQGESVYHGLPHQIIHPDYSPA